MKKRIAIKRIQFLVLLVIGCLLVIGVSISIAEVINEIFLSEAQKPTAKAHLVYSGSAQELINAPAEALPEGATGMRYALGTDTTTVPDESAYTASVPSKTDAGTYYVWYKAVGDDNHNDTNPASIQVSIARLRENSPTDAEAQVKLDINYPNETISAENGYDVADESFAYITSISSVLDNNSPKVYVRKGPRDGNYSPSDWVSVTLASRPAEPAGLTTTSATNGSTADGKIIGTTTAMEYKSPNGQWQTASDSETAVGPGEYSVRFKATASTPSGIPKEVEVENSVVLLNDSNKPVIRLPDNHTAPVVGDTLTASTTAAPVTYQWYVDGTAVSGAVNATYTVQTEDNGKVICVEAIQRIGYDGNSLQAPITMRSEEFSCVGTDWLFLSEGQKPTAKANLVYSGSAQELINAPAEALPAGAKEMQYAFGTDKKTVPDKSAFTASVPSKTDAGDYYVWYKAVGDANHNDTNPALIKVSIARLREDSPSHTEAQEKLDINYPNETISAKDGYNVADENFAYITSISPILDNNSPKVYVRKGPRDGNYFPSYWVAVTLASRPNEPTGLTTTGATNSSTADGKIIGTTGAMEYSADNGMSWHDASNTETYVTPGTYLVRVKAISSAPHGLTSQVTVDNREIIFLDGQKPTAKAHLVYSGSAQELINAPVGLPKGATGMLYAFGTDTKTVPDKSAFTASVPSKTDAGDYYVWYKVVGDANHNDTNPALIKVSIARLRENSPTYAEALEKLVISYPNETISAGKDYDVANDKYEYITSISSVLDNNPPKVYVRKGPRDGNYFPSDWVSVTLASRPNEPTGLTTTGATNSSTADGKIIGTTSAMEYSADNGMSWHDASNTETYVTPGTYLVRVKAISSAPHGLTSQVTVDNREIIFLDGQKPTAKTDLVYSASPQELINAPAGLPKGAKVMKYAIGTDSTSVPDESSFTTSVPSKTDIGTYYVWYKAVADPKHDDSTPVCLEVTIATVSGKVISDFENVADDSGIKGLNEEMIGDQMKEIALSDDTSIDSTEVKIVEVTLSAQKTSEQEVPVKEKEAIDQAVETIISIKDSESLNLDLLDISLEKTVTVYDVEDTEKKSKVQTSKLSNLNRVIDIPVRYDLSDKYNIHVVRYHEGVAQVFTRLSAKPDTANMRDATFFIEGSGADSIIHIYTSCFSTYALASFGDEEQDSNPSGYYVDFDVTVIGGPDGVKPIPYRNGVQDHRRVVIDLGNGKYRMYVNPELRSQYYFVMMPIYGYYIEYRNAQGVVVDRGLHGGTIFLLLIPPTGDRSNIFIWLGLASIAFIVIVTLVRKKR